MSRLSARKDSNPVVQSFSRYLRVGILLFFAVRPVVRRRELDQHLEVSIHDVSRKDLTS